MNVQRFYDDQITLIHGDCLDVLPKIKAGLIDMVFADLPYGTTDCKWDSVLDLTALWINLNKVCKPRSAQVFTATAPFEHVLWYSNKNNWRHDWIWNKKLSGNFATAKYRPMTITEKIMIFGQQPPNYYPQMIIGKLRRKGGEYNKITQITSGIRTVTSSINDQYYPKNIIEIGNTDRRNSVHPTQKPVELLEYLIKTYTNEGDYVLDPTMGSGTTAVACVNTKRRFIGIELNEAYFTIAIQRITGEI